GPEARSRDPRPRGRFGRRSPATGGRDQRDARLTTGIFCMHRFRVEAAGRTVRSAGPTSLGLIGRRVLTAPCDKGGYSESADPRSGKGSWKLRLGSSGNRALLNQACSQADSIFVRWGDARGNDSSFVAPPEISPASSGTFSTHPPTDARAGAIRPIGSF